MPILMTIQKLPNLPLKWRLLFLLIRGAVNGLAFAPIDWFWCAFLALGALFWLLSHSHKPSHGFWLAYAYGFGLFVGSLHWGFISIQQYTNLPFNDCFAAYCFVVCYFEP